MSDALQAANKIATSIPGYSESVSENVLKIAEPSSSAGISTDGLIRVVDNRTTGLPRLKRQPEACIGCGAPRGGRYQGMTWTPPSDDPTPAMTICMVCLFRALKWAAAQAPPLEGE